MAEISSAERWRCNAELLLVSERAIAPETPLFELSLHSLPGRRLLFKDESMHPTGSLKHRLARALVLQGLRSRAIGEGTALFDASSGNTAIAEAWFAQLLRLPYFAVVPETLSPGKRELIERFGGHCIRVPAGQCWLTRQDLETAPWERALETWRSTGRWLPPITARASHNRLTSMRHAATGATLRPGA
jgi:cysteine synthase